MAKLIDIEIDEYLKQCVDLAPEAISEEYARLSADYAYWNEKFARANRAHLEAEWQEEKIEARLYLKHKEPAGEAKKVPTEKAVESAVKMDPLYEEAHLRTIEHQHERDYLRGVLQNLRLKAEMLVSMGATMRQEIQGDLRMRERQETRRAAEGFAE